MMTNKNISKKNYRISLSDQCDKVRVNYNDNFFNLTFPASFWFIFWCFQTTMGTIEQQINVKNSDWLNIFKQPIRLLKASEAKFTVKSFLTG